MTLVNFDECLGFDPNPPPPPFLRQNPNFCHFVFLDSFPISWWKSGEIQVLQSASGADRDQTIADEDNDLEREAEVWNFPEFAQPTFYRGFNTRLGPM